jgi:hypothetical protein
VPFALERPFCSTFMTLPLQTRAPAADMLASGRRLGEPY